MLNFLLIFSPSLTFKHKLMEFYNFADAKYLLAYYTDKLIGKVLSHKSEAVITHLEIDDWANGNYRLMAKGTLHTERDVCDIAKFHDIVYPVHVLKERVL